MFGYVNVNQDELKIKDYTRYRAFYCGLCYCLKKKFGVVGQGTLSYDMTFVDILLNALYEKPLMEAERACIVHPTKKHKTLYNEITDYCADMSILLSYYKAVDDAIDEKPVREKRSQRKEAGNKEKINKKEAKRIVVSRALTKAYRNVDSRYPEKSAAIKRAIETLNACEKDEDYDLDRVSGITGRILATIFAYKDDEWKMDMQRVGFYLGKFVYLMDAYDDLQDDIKKNRYNVWKPYMNNKDFDAYAENTMTLMMADCAKEFERLPIVQDVDILRNIIYSGVWLKYAMIQKQKMKGQENDS